MTLRCDLIFRDATVFDGTGAPRFNADVGVNGDRIVAVGDLGAMAADRDVIATGKALAPGFIDAHTHDDKAVLCGPACMECKTSQGVTSVVVGNCGISLSPVRLTVPPPPPLNLMGGRSEWVFDSFAAYAEKLTREPASVNTYALIGHMSLRVQAMGGDVRRAATDKEAEQMRRWLTDALTQGASGFSTGLYYPPNMDATTDEVIAVAEALSAFNGIYVTHMRDESDHVLDSIQETLAIGRAAKVPVVISHHKCSMPENFGRSRQTLPAMDLASLDQQVAFDVYPYIAGSTVLMADRVRQDIKIMITWSSPHPAMAGRVLDDIAREWNVTQREAAERLQPAGATSFQMQEEDVRRIMNHHLSMIGSDGIPQEDGFPHPRLWGTFPRVLGHYARDLGLFTLETAVHKMTGRAASVYGIADRGVIRPGGYADLVLFDPATVRDTATYEAPMTPADGILETWVNGRSTYVHGTGATDARAGRVITRTRGP